MATFRSKQSTSWRTFIASMSFLSACSAATTMQADDGFEAAPIHYSTSDSHDPVSVLQKKLADKTVRLTRDEHFGYLPSLLAALNVSPESQVLVFSKTSLQIHKISPTNPRAIFFNDSVYVGYVPGSDILELAANDPVLGAVFYTFDSNNEDPTIEDGAAKSDANPRGPNSKEPSDAKDKEWISGPRILRDRGQCLSCHATSRTENVPGYLVRSIYPDRAGRARTGSSSYTTDYRTPWDQRWGGWYVTGNHGGMRHMGNAFAVDREDPQKLDVESGANLKTLPSRVRPDIHLNPRSDLVALLVLEHQVRVHNLITRANFETRQAVHLDEVMNKALDRPADYRSETTTRRIASAGNALLEAMFLIDEPNLDAPVSGTSHFADGFAKEGPKSNDGRSLRDLDLEKRLFKNRFSYLAYTPEFRQLPEPMMTFIKGRMQEILYSENAPAPFSQISESDRESIRVILKQTMPELVTMN